MSVDDGDDEGLDEIPVGDLVVDVRHFEMRLPGADCWRRNNDLDQGQIPEDSVRALSLPTVAEALGLLSERIEDGAPGTWFLETDPPNRMYEIELHEGLGQESHGGDHLYVTVSIGLPAYVDEEFERGVEELVDVPREVVSGWRFTSGRLLRLWVLREVHTRGGPGWVSTLGRSSDRLDGLSLRGFSWMRGRRRGRPRPPLRRGWDGAAVEAEASGCQRG